MYGIIQGVGMIAGGEQRLGGPAYLMMREVPHTALTWGLWVTIAGTLILTSSISAAWWHGAFWMKAIGLLMLSAWCTAFAVSASAATVTIKTAGSTGGPTYLLIAFTSFIVVVIDEGAPFHAKP